MHKNLESKLIVIMAIAAGTMILATGALGIPVLAQNATSGNKTSTTTGNTMSANTTTPSVPPIPKSAAPSSSTPGY
jgi:hypothetical protein